MIITVQPEAAKWISAQLEQRGKGEGIRFAVKTTGCSGYMYVVEFVDEPSIEDTVFEQHNLKFFIDPKSLVFLTGINVGFRTEGLNSGLYFTNPNATGECGCGESFSV